MSVGTCQSQVPAWPGTEGAIVETTVPHPLRSWIVRLAPVSPRWFQVIVRISPPAQVSPPFGAVTVTEFGKTSSVVPGRIVRGRPRCV